jgi:hypothetical protein
MRASMVHVTNLTPPGSDSPKGRGANVDICGGCAEDEDAEDAEEDALPPAKDTSTLLGDPGDLNIDKA